MDLDISKLDDGSGIQTTLKKNKAKWHKSCSNKYSTLKLQRLQAKIEKLNKSLNSPVKTRQKLNTKLDSPMEQCIFCGKGNENNKLHTASSAKIDEHVRIHAQNILDREIMAKLSSGDMTAIDARYHDICLASFYNKSCKSKLDDIHNTTSPQSLALAELISHIMDTHDKENCPKFKLSELCKLYSNRIDQLCPDAPKTNSTRVKERLMVQLPQLRAYNHGREVWLMFDDDVGETVKRATLYDEDCASVHLACAASIVRDEILKQETFFDRSMKTGCQKESIPRSLLTLVKMILQGPGIQSQSSTKSDNNAATTISQLLMFNTYETVNLESAVKKA